MGDAVVFLLILATALTVRYWGIHWSRLHPDEGKIGEWVEYNDSHSNLDHSYPGGYFTMLKAVRTAARGIGDARRLWSIWTGASNRIVTEPLDATVTGRLFNVWVGALTCCLVFLIVRRITGSLPAGTFAGLLLCFSQYHVEHSHYAETDVAMVFVLVLSLFLWERFSHTKRALDFCIASLASGFAAGTKYYLVVLLPTVIVAALIEMIRTGKDKKERSARGSVILLLLGVLLFVGGFVWATPYALEAGEFAHDLQLKARHIERENIGILGQAYGTEGAVLANVVRQLRMFGATLGLAWGLLALVGTGIAISRFYRRLHYLLMPVALLLFHFLFSAPWMRSQECMLFLPTLAILAAFPMAYIHRPRLSGARKALAVLALVAGVFALGRGYCRSVAVAGDFGWVDPRVAGRMWLSLHGVGEKKVGAEIYTRPAGLVSSRTLAIGKAEKIGINKLVEEDCDYVVRNAHMAGRGTLNPKTGKRFEDYEESYEEFVSGSELLRVWSPINSSVRATFTGGEIQLYGIGAREPEYEIETIVPRPYYRSETGRETFYPVGHMLGAGYCVVLDRRPRWLAVGGPEHEGPVFLILNTLERKTEIEVEGFGEKRRLCLGAFQTAVLRLERPAWRPRCSKYEIIRIHPDPGRHVDHIPCLARVAFSAGEAALISAQGGLAESDYMEIESGDDFSCRNAGAVYGWAVEGGRWETASSLRSAAARQLDNIGRYLSFSGEKSINGISSYQWRELSNITVQSPDEEWIALVKGLCCGNDQIEEGLRTYQGHLYLPALLPQGRYRVTFDLVAPMVGSRYSSLPGDFELVDGDGHVWVRGDWDNYDTAEGIKVSLALTMLREKLPDLCLRSARAVEAPYRNLSIEWSPDEALETMHDWLVCALATHSMETGRFDEALSVLEKTVGDPCNRLNVARIRLRSLIEGNVGSLEEALSIAREIIKIAPAHYRSLVVLAETDAALEQEALRLRDSGMEPVIFDPFVSLVACDLDQTARVLRLVFEARRDGAPPLVCEAAFNKKGRWRGKSRVPVGGDGRSLMKGERVEARVQLGPEFGGNIEPGRVGVCVRSNVEFGAGALRVEGVEGEYLTLSRVIPGPRNL